MLELRNPHSILAALQVRPRAVKSVRVAAVLEGDVWHSVVHQARRHEVPVTVGQPERRGPAKGGREGGRDTERVGAGSALVEPPSPVPLERLWADASAERTAAPAAEAQPFGLWLALDQVQDPQNLGAVFRLAGFFGIRGILLTKDRSAPVNATVCDVATGGVEFVPFSVVANLAQAMEKCQQHGIWVVGTCERADSSIHSLRRDRHWMLVMGNEGQGLRRLTRERCDQLVGLPALGPVPSLNIATATAACLALLTHAGP